MKILLSLLTLFTQVALYAAVEPRALDLKLPSQAMLEKQTITGPLVSSATRVLSANAGPTSAAVKVVSTFAAQPDVARNLIITPGGTTGDIESCVIVVAGTNILGGTISESFTFAADATGAQTGSKAFKTVTSVTWPANCESGGFAATWSVGTSTKLGLKRCMANAGSFFHAVFNGVKETTAPTIASSATAVGSNTAILNSTLDGSDVILYFEQNYACLP